MTTVTNSTNKTNAKAKPAKDTVAASTTPVSDKVTEVLHESVDTLGVHASVTEDKIRNTAASSADILSEKSEEIKACWNNSAVGKYTKENPLAAAGIAFTAGVLLTSLLKRK